tara:strand:+ start:141 stop:866 length:726 start_codon:yes stop_codon:yes gene_type:complete
MKNYKLIISYDGTDFHGFQIQKDKKTVQGELQKAFEIFTEKYELNYSGRTDAGVHAKGQVVNIKTEFDLNDKTINSLNKILGPKIFINYFKKINYNFHARYDAIERIYKYFVSDITQQYPYLSSHSYVYPKKLDLKKLNYVAELFIGEHNFSAFSKHDINKNPNRKIYNSKWIKKRDFFEYTITGNSFLRNMVRNIVGVQLAYCEDKVTFEEVSKNLINPKKARLNHVAPPNGLVLWNVKY